MWLERYSEKYIFEYVDNCENNNYQLNDFNGNGTIIIKNTGKNNVIIFGKENTVNRELHISCVGTPSIPIVENILISIENNNIFNGNVYINAPEGAGCSIIIGNSNLFANRVLLMGTQNHGIFDLETGDLLNSYKDIYLGNHNWICKDAEFFPGGKILNNCVVAAHTLVNKCFDLDNCMLAGIPAAVKRVGIIWDIGTELI